MKGINKVSRFHKHTLFSILFGWQWYSLGIIELNRSIPIEKWCLLSEEHTKPQKMKRIHGERENFLQWCGVTTCEAHQRNEISAFACVSRHLLVHWVLADESFMNALKPLIETRFSDWFVISYVYRNFVMHAKQSGRRKLAQEGCEKKTKKSPNFGLERSNSERISAFGAIVDARQCRRICGFVFRGLLLVPFSRLHSQMSWKVFSL